MIQTNLFPEPTKIPPSTANEEATYSGFCLHSLEVLNWGTFDQSIKRLTVDGQNCLLTGNIGSGKSTLIDALTALLVPPRKLAFNKAAGAHTGERNLLSYFHGFYTSERGDYGYARHKGLRPEAKHYSVLLAKFRNEALQESLTLAKIIWLKPGEKRVTKLFVVSRQELSIQQHFNGFSNIKEFKKYLAAIPETQLFDDNFKQYAQAFGKILGISPQSKALNLFNQTVSMKQVGSVTEFVREHMLDQPELESKLVELQHNYEDLNRLHEAVLEAKQKVELLTPIVTKGRECLELKQQSRFNYDAKEILDAYFNEKRGVLLSQRIERRLKELDKLNAQIEQQRLQKRELESNADQLSENIRKHGGDRLQQLREKIHELTRVRDKKRKNYGVYQTYAKQFELPDPLSIDVFFSNQSQTQATVEKAKEEADRVDQDRLTLEPERRKIIEQGEAVGREIESLEGRPSNIPAAQITIRDRIAEAVGLDQENIPFVGELLEVKDSEKPVWEGAIERVLHNFALSLLIPESHYRRVADFVEQTNLRGKLVYYRVKDEPIKINRSPRPHSIFEKVNIRRESHFYQWLKQQLVDRFDIICCQDMGDFRREPRALTPNGQIKSGNNRHEKDDRHNIHDRTRDVLGWNNRTKLKLLKVKRDDLVRQLEDADRKSKELKSHFERWNKRVTDGNSFINSFTDFDDINFQIEVEKLQRVSEEKDSLESSSDILRALTQQFETVKRSIRDVENTLETGLTEKGQINTNIERDRGEQQIAEQSAATVGDNEKLKHYGYIENYFRNLPDTTLNLNSIDKRKSEVNTKLYEQGRKLDEKAQRRESETVKSMAQFNNQFPADSTEMDSSLDALDEFASLLKTLATEDLPRHETRFREMLKNDTIKSMAVFRAQLDSQSDDIRESINNINHALASLEYGEGTFIAIEIERSLDNDIKEFLAKMKECTELATEDIYAEEKFLRIKSLIERFKGEPEWTKKVTDVRNWHIFNVAERSKEDNTLIELFSDSAGKSGGQKEKLAYSILAAAIMLQYGLIKKFGETQDRQRRFNLVVIDEAFGRGSNESTRFGLKLFQKLGLQLMLVTPLQKLNVIEDYVGRVHYISQRDSDRRSHVLNMTIAEYKERKQEFIRSRDDILSQLFKTAQG